MVDDTKIEWADSTFNPWIGCTKISPGCDHCYAEADFDLRKHRVRWGAGNPRSRTSVTNWNAPLVWERAHESFFLRHGRRRRVFCASLADVFDNEVPQQWRVDLLKLIANTPNLNWMLLTKRIGKAREMLDDALGELSHGLTRWEDAPWPNVWIGATIVNQEEADRDIPKLIATPARVRFLSCEPLLGRVDLCELLGMWWNQTMQCFEGTGQQINRLPNGQRKIDWIIAGGESGIGARPMRAEWAKTLRRQCAGAAIPFFFKQWGNWLPDGQHGGDPTLTVHTHRWGIGLDGVPELSARYTKKLAGRLLDGVEHNEFPER